MRDSPKCVPWIYRWVILQTTWNSNPVKKISWRRNFLRVSEREFLQESERRNNPDILENVLSEFLEKEFPKIPGGDFLWIWEKEIPERGRGAAWDSKISWSSSHSWFHRTTHSWRGPQNPSELQWEEFCRIPVNQRFSTCSTCTPEGT